MSAGRTLRSQGLFHAGNHSKLELAPCGLLYFFFFSLFFCFVLFFLFFLSSFFFFFHFVFSLNVFFVLFCFVSRTIKSCDQAGLECHSYKIRIYRSLQQRDRQLAPRARGHSSSYAPGTPPALRGPLVRQPFSPFSVPSAPGACPALPGSSSGCSAIGVGMLFILPTHPQPRATRG